MNRKAVVAGRFYPENKEELINDIKINLNSV
jgi:predicted class III extradiol MEMO1 family dioxygenase